MYSPGELGPFVLSGASRIGFETGLPQNLQCSRMGREATARASIVTARCETIRASSAAY